MIAALADHLWQSTLFVVAAALVAAALRKNGAHIRHRVWVIASVKFLVPFAVLMSLGSALPRGATPGTVSSAVTAPMAPDLSVTVDRIAQPFTTDVFFEMSPATTVGGSINWTAMILGGTWGSGLVAVAFMRLRGWRRIRAAMRTSEPVQLTSPVPVRSAPGLLEPGVVGLWRPVLLVPAGIEQHLTTPQLEAVLTHELCHVQRRDNLTSALHMVVEAAFWFHPLVWFIGARLVEERERACDEHVLRVCQEPRVYAEGILNVCKLYAELPIACVSGVSGSDLKKRIVAIIANRIGLQLTFMRRAALAVAATLAVIVPLGVGVLIAPMRARAEAQSVKADASAPSPTFDLVSIKPCPGLDVVRPLGSGRGANPRAPQPSPGHVYWECVSLSELIDQAWGGLGSGSAGNLLLNTRLDAGPDSPKRVRGGPSWVDDDRFTIEAKMSGGPTEGPTAATRSQWTVYMREQMPRALRAMLEDRFQLKLRKATEQQSMYAMTVAKGGLKVTPSVPGECWQFVAGRGRGAPPGFEGKPSCGNVRGTISLDAQAFMKSGVDPSTFTFVPLRRFEYTALSMEDVAKELSSRMDRYVLDKTGVDGKFTFAYEYAPDDSTPADRREAEQALTPTAGPTIFKALETLGLKLEPTRGPSEYLQIESVQRPTPNAPAADALEPPARAQGASRGAPSQRVTGAGKSLR